MSNNTGIYASKSGLIPIRRVFLSTALDCTPIPDNLDIQGFLVRMSRMFIIILASASNKLV
jgi:hypothetical protein